MYIFFFKFSKICPDLLRSGSGSNHGLLTIKFLSPVKSSSNSKLNLLHSISRIFIALKLEIEFKYHIRSQWKRARMKRMCMVNKLFLKNKSLTWSQIHETEQKRGYVITNYVCKDC